MVPALLYRLDRCAEGDQALLRALLDQLGDPVAPDEGPDSVALQYHVLLSELWTPASDLRSLEAIEDELVFATGGPVEAARLQPSWPVYPLDEFVTERAHTSVPMLMLSGTLDPQTPPSLARPLSGADGPGQHFVSVPWAAHGVVFQSPTEDGTQCGAELMADFLRDPLTLDRGCIDRLRRPDFDGAQVARDYLGLEDLWDAEVDDGTVDLLEMDPDVQARWDDLRRARAWF